MARIRLYMPQSLRTPAAWVTTEQGQRALVPFLRVIAMVRVGGRKASAQEAIIDTGAPLTVVPRIRWEPVANRILWVPVDETDPVNFWLTTITGKTGGRCPCRVGRIDMLALDLERP